MEDSTSRSRLRAGEERRGEGGQGGKGGKGSVLFIFGSGLTVVKCFARTTSAPDCGTFLSGVR